VTKDSQPAAVPGPALMLAAALIGAAVVVVSFGPTPLEFWQGVLSPSATGWMLAGPMGPDPVQYWLGWSWFRRDGWHIPPGLNPDYGLELAASIFYADIIPLIALPLKALSGVVTVEQYWGMWLLGCGIAQAVLGLRLAALSGVGGTAAGNAALLAVSAIIALQPMMLMRMAGHLALAGQWTVLTALLLCFTEGRGWRRPVAWGALVLATSLVHSYLLVMVGGLWGADWLRRAIAAPSAARLIEAALVPALALAGLWAAGFFVLRGGLEAWGYGDLGFNVFAWFDSTLWGSLLPPIPDLRHGESGSDYLGLGGIGLLLVGLSVALVRRDLGIGAALLRRWPLVLAVVAMALFAATHKPSFAGVRLTLFEPSPWLLSLAGILRASTRFAWPLAYALLAAAAILLLRAAAPRHLPRAAMLLAALAAVQIVDLWPSIRHYESLVIKQPRIQPERLPDPFWDTLGAAYTRIRAVPAADRGLHWESTARFAIRHDMTTDAVYLARIDPATVTALRAQVAARLFSGEHEPGTLYVLRDRESLIRADFGRDRGRDPILLLDGLVVFVPGWGERDIPAHIPRLMPPFEGLPEGTITEGRR
jgi:hypothetical protein